MKYTIISAIPKEHTFGGEVQNAIGAAIGIGGQNALALASTMWIFKTNEAHAAYTKLLDILRHYQMTFVMLSFEYAPLLDISPEKSLELQKFLSDNN